MALTDAGKFAASAAPSRKRAAAKAITVLASAWAAAMTDQRINASDSPNFTPFVSISRPASDGKIAYERVNANVIHP
jgi:hypothetical protein